jgi:putative colanic acid biosynthesis acetyltransferase WcaB
MQNDTGRHRLSRHLVQDWTVNSGTPHAQFGMVLFRLAQTGRHHGSALSYILKVPFMLFALFTTCEIETGATIGPRLQIFHPHNIVINGRSVIGADCVLRHGVTIGNKGSGTTPYECPVIGDRVNIGAGSSIVGPISIGDDVTIGIGSVVVKSIEPGATVAGNPARAIISPNPGPS